MRVTNFGRNVSFEPSAYFEPKCADDVLEILRFNRTSRIRTIGRLHSWSEVQKSEDVLINLAHLDQVEVDESQRSVVVGAGCQIKQLIGALDAVGLALPTQGLIAEQTVAGAISTGTHGSGKQCISHFVEEVTVATYDPDTDEPVIKTISEGAELSAAQCSVGCVGVIIAVKMVCQVQYNIQEHFQFFDSLPTVLESEKEYPLQQFFLLPHSWDLMAQHRRVSDKQRSQSSMLYQIYWFLVVDVGLHAILLLLTRVIRAKSLIRFFYRFVVPWTIFRNWKVVDKSQRLLTMKHELFKHIEIELFVKHSNLERLLEFVRSLLCFCDGRPSATDMQVLSNLDNPELFEDLESLAGTYTHHYPICIRKVLPDTTLISTSSGGDESYYAVSFISYHGPNNRDGFYGFASFLARSTAVLFGARPHWGKVCPVDSESVERLYPRLSEFRDILNDLDPKGRFRNEWIDRTLFPPKRQHAPMGDHITTDTDS